MNLFHETPETAAKLLRDAQFDVEVFDDHVFGTYGPVIFRLWGNPIVTVEVAGPMDMKFADVVVGALTLSGDTNPTDAILWIRQVLRLALTNIGLQKSHWGVLGTTTVGDLSLTLSILDRTLAFTIRPVSENRP